MLSVTAVVLSTSSNQTSNSHVGKSVNKDHPMRAYSASVLLLNVTRRSTPYVPALALHGPHLEMRERSCSLNNAPLTLSSRPETEIWRVATQAPTAWSHCLISRFSMYRAGTGEQCMLLGSASGALWKWYGRSFCRSM